MTEQDGSIPLAEPTRAGPQFARGEISKRYLARVHEQVLQRPLYLVSRVVRGEDETGGVSARSDPRGVVRLARCEP